MVTRLLLSAEDSARVRAELRRASRVSSEGSDRAADADAVPADERPPAPRPAKILTIEREGQELVLLVRVLL